MRINLKTLKNIVSNCKKTFNMTAKELSKQYINFIRKYNTVKVSCETEEKGYYEIIHVEEMITEIIEINVEFTKLDALLKVIKTNEIDLDITENNLKIKSDIMEVELANVEIDVLEQQAIRLRHSKIRPMFKKDVNFQQLIAAVNKTKHSMTASNINEFYGCFIFNNDKVYTTDIHRLSHSISGLITNEQFGIEENDMLTIIDVFKNEENVDFFFEPEDIEANEKSRYLKVSSCNKVFLSKFKIIKKSDIPNLEMVIRECEDTYFEIDRMTLVNKIKALISVCKTEKVLPVTIESDLKTVNFSVKTDTYNINFDLPMIKNDKKCKACINAKYLLKALTTSKDKTIQIFTAETLKPIGIGSNEILIMPMRP